MLRGYVWISAPSRMKNFDRLIHTGFLRVHYTNCYENGLPQPDETQRLNRIEDWLDEKGKTFPIWLVGVVTQQGWRDFVFHVGRGS
ncbi:Cytoplasmic protein [Salmonella enterica subsp. enterica]|uniref:Cytoplasmic protein n=1 Tax=Salmonella enterica I TaxID=59201 RepID=A0A379WKJ5_SALET|nr:Cytoplasmic protein [Salmonella enterica subsp. enterica]